MIRIGLPARVALATAGLVAAAALALAALYDVEVQALAADGPAVAAALDGLRARIVTAGGALALVAGVLTYLYARWLMRPAGQLIRAMHQLSEAEEIDRDARRALEKQLPRHAAGELGALAWAVRRLLRDLQQVEEHGVKTRTSAILDSLADGVITINERGIVRSFNPAAEEMFGYHRDEVIGNNVSMLMPAHHAKQHDDYLRRYLRTGKRRMIGHKRELEGQRKDYTTFPIELAVTELRFGEERIYAGMVRDISARRSQQVALTRNEARMRAVLDTAADGIITTNELGIIESFNPAAERMFGYPAEDVIGQHVSQLLPSAFEGDFASYVTANAPANGTARANGTSDDAAQSGHAGLSRPPEIQAQRQDGSVFPIELSVSEAELGKEHICTAIVRDVTERKEQEAALARRAEELTRSNEELAQFAYVASHDLQEPLRMVASYTQLLQRRYAGQLDDDADEFIAYAVDGAARMQRLIQDLLAYSRVGTASADFAPTDLNLVLRNVLHNLQSTLEETGATVHSDELPTVNADGSQLEQLLQNLVSNGVKFHGDEPPEVTISVERDGDHWQFAVQDNGIGIDDEYFDRIFVIFQRLHTKAEYPGTGIGLAICKKIVERHGGRIWVESSPGGGSTFYFTLTADLNAPPEPAEPVAVLAAEH